MHESSVPKEGAEAVREHIEEQAKGFLAFTGVHKPPPNAVFLLVMGMTGSGKSSFVSSCTGRNVVVGHGLQSCTSDISIFDFTLGNHKVYLIDTPGFNDTHNSDAETLATVATYLGTSCAQNVFIHGVLYLHRISDNRIGGSARRNIDMLKALVGEAAYTNVALVTTMWGRGGGSATTAATTEPKETLMRREEELRTDKSFFAELIAGGASLVRHGDFSSNRPREPSENSNDELLRGSALSIVRQLISQARAAGGPAVLLIQHELVEEKKRLEQTSAGAIVLGDLRRMAADYRGQLMTLKELMQSKPKGTTTTAAQQNAEMSGKEHRQDAVAAGEMEELRAEFKEKLATVSRELKVLNSGLGALQSREQDVLTQKLEAAEQRFRAELELKEKRLLELERSLQRMRRSDADNPADATATSRVRPRKTELADRQLLPQVSRVREEVRKGREALAGLARTTHGVKEGVATGLASSVSSALVAGAVTAVAGAVVCVLM